MEIYTDGACKGNPGKGGWAFVVVLEDKKTYFDTGKEINTTNNRMELTAVLKALEYSCENNVSDLLIYSDSAYIVNCFNEKWTDKWISNGWKTSKKKDVLNQDLWKSILELHKKINKISYVFVKGHSGNKYNEEADKLASSAALL